MYRLAQPFSSYASVAAKKDAVPFPVKVVEWSIIPLLQLFSSDSEPYAIEIGHT